MANEIYVRTDEHGVMRVADSRVMLDSVVAAYHQGHSAETIQQQFPALTLESVYGAIAYYLGHRQDVDAYLTKQGEVWRRSHEEWNARSATLIQRLRDEQRVASASRP